MKKTYIWVAALMLALLVLCTACSGSDSAPEKEAEAEPSQLPSVTAPPEGEGTADDGILKANANAFGTASFYDRDSWLASLSEDQRLVEEELIGQPVDDLYKAIGKPKSANYSTSCLVLDGEDGLLEYDGFTVATTRFPNGEELVMGTAN